MWLPQDLQTTTPTDHAPWVWTASYEPVFTLSQETCLHEELPSGVFHTHPSLINCIRSDHEFLATAIVHVPYSGKVWQTDSFGAFGKRNFSELADQPIGYWL